MDEPFLMNNRPSTCSLSSLKLLARSHNIFEPLNFIECSATFRLPKRSLERIRFSEMAFFKLSQNSASLYAHLAG